MTHATNSTRGKSTLRSITILLVCSGLLRLFGASSSALAQDASDADPGPQVSQETVLGIPFSEEKISELLAVFRSRETQLLEQEAKLAQLKATLDNAESTITAKISELTEIEQKLAGTLALADTAAENDLARLATVYENMKPRDTAALFSEMNAGFAAGFLGLMKPETAAAVMTELEPNVAYTISVMLAGRNANAFNID